MSGKVMQFTCNLCGDIFTRPFSLRVHSKIEHGIDSVHPKDIEP